jgi:DeoR family fructose operon transcriptional repressor
LSHEQNLNERTDHRETKTLIAKAAILELNEGGTVFIESGSTTGILAQLIPSHFALTVITNSLQIANTVMVLPLVTCHLVGGYVRPVTGATTGYWALRQLSDVAVDTAFLGVNAISATGELSTPNGDEAIIKAAALGLGARTIVLADHSKRGLRALHRYGTLADVCLLITDTPTNNQLPLHLEYSPNETRYI